MKASKKCIICNNDEVDMLYLPLSIVECKACKLIYRDAEFDVGLHYVDLKAYKEGLEDTVKLAVRRKNAEHRFDLMGKVTSKKGKFLDIGTNEGITLLEAEKKGFKALGCEPNIYAVQYGKSMGLNIINKSFEGSFEEILQQSPFDFVSMFHVLEHFPDPNKTLQMIRKILSQDSYLIIEVPDISSPWSRIYKWDDLRITKEHLFYFTQPTLNALLKNNGFEVVFSKRISADELNRSLFDNMIRLPLFTQAYMVARKLKQTLKKFFGSPTPPRKTIDDNIELWITGKMLDKRYFLSRPLGKIISYFNRGDDLFVIARKNKINEEIY